MIELLTVIAIIGILAAILIPVVGRVRSTARAAECVSNLRQLSSAAVLYAEENKGRLPTSYDGTLEGMWYTALTPLIASQKIQPQNWGQLTRIVSSPGPFKCPVVDPTDAAYTNPWLSYKMNCQLQDKPSGAPAPVAGLPLARIGRPSATLLFAEGRSHSAFWTWDPAAVTQGLWYPHDSQVNVSFVDGHVVRQKPTDLEARWNDIYKP